MSLRSGWCSGQECRDRREALSRQGGKHVQMPCRERRIWRIVIRSEGVCFYSPLNPQAWYNRHLIFVELRKVHSGGGAWHEVSQTVQVLVRLCQEFGFYSKAHGRPLKAVKWGGKGDMVRLAFLLDHSCSWLGNQ